LSSALHSGGTIKPVLLPVFIFFSLISFFSSTTARAQCIPSSAQMLVSGDDTTYAWINGTLVAGPVSYCGGACVPVPINIPVAVFNQGQNILLAVETDNLNPSQIFSSWELEITCSGGFQWVMSSQSYASIPLYFDPNGAGAGVTGCSGIGAIPPTTDGSGNPWTSYIYNPASNPFTLAGAPVTGSTYAAPIYNPVSLALIPPVSYNASGNVPGSCGILYWRQLVVIPTPTFTPTLTSTLTATLTPTLTPTLTFTFTATITPTNTFTNTPTITYTPTNTFSPTPTFTNTNTFTATNSPTITPTNTPTNTPTKTLTPTNTFTPTSTPTPCGYPGNTCTPTPTPANLDIFYVNKNLFTPSTDRSVSIYVAYSKVPGDYSFRVYNTAGEHIKTLDTKHLNSTITQSYQWDGTNKNGDPCASGVYLLYLIEPFDRKIKRLLLVR
jgi:hypothetical protein